MSFRLAVDRLASKTFTGVTTSYDVDQLPPMLAMADLPALVIRLIPSRDAQDSLALQVLTYDAGFWWASLYIEHICYWMRSGDGLYKEFMPNMFNFVDTYLAKVAGDPRLNSNLDEDLAVISVDVAEVNYPPDRDKAPKYYAIRFLHRWKIKITAVA
jgi:hypothetical protein